MRTDVTETSIDPNGNYEPGNCRWATAKEQARNRTNNRIVDGMTLVELAEKTGAKYTTLRARINAAVRKAVQ